MESLLQNILHLSQEVAAIFILGLYNHKASHFWMQTPVVLEKPGFIWLSS